MKYSIVQDSRKGARPYNQDRVGHWRTSEALLMAVADGMGGYAGGELAAQAALDAIANAFASAATPRIADPDRFVSRAAELAHAAVVEKGRHAGLGDAPRTTLVACLVQAGFAYWTFVGDSRLYLMRAGRVALRTRDHTSLQQLVDAGRIREEAVATHPERNKLLRCLGGSTAPAFEPTVSASLTKNDILLLCSDGLWGPLPPRQLLMGFIGREPARALPELMQRAEAHAGRDCDNVSAVAMHWQEEAAAAVAC
jgi:serine/threonine protein phosphatase PrpC